MSLKMAFNDSAEELRYLQRCMSDLVSVLALPAVCSGQEPRKIVTTYHDALMATLNLDFLHTRVRIDANGEPIEVMETAPHYATTQSADKIRQALSGRFGDDPREWPAEARGRPGERETSLLSMRLGLDGEIGIVVAGSERADFPTQSERLLLGVAANQVTVGLQQARLLSEQKRIADEFERRVAERTRELAETNEALQLQVEVLQHLPVVAWTLKPDGTPDFVNQVWLEYSGQTLAFVCSRPEAWMTAVHPEDRETASRIFWEGVRSGRNFAIETRFRAQDGTYRWHLNRAVVLRDAGGKVLKFVGTSTDIDDQKRAEEELRASENDLRKILNGIPGFVCTLSPSGQVKLPNRRLLEYFGKTLDEVNSWSTNDLVHPDDLPRVTAELTHSFTTGTPYDSELRYRRADGVYRWFQVRILPVRDTEGRITRWYGLITEIEGRKRAEEALQSSERNLSLIINTMPVLAWSGRPDGGAEFLNQRWLEYSGFSAEQAKDWGWTAAIHPDDLNRLSDRWQSAIVTGEPVEIEARMRRFDGTYRWFLFRANPLRDVSGNIAKWYGTNVDIEDRKRSEEALRESEQRFRLIADGIAGLVAIMSPIGEVEDVNRQVLTYFGKTVEQLKGWSTSDEVHPDDMPRVVSAWARSVESACVYDIDHRLRRADSEYRWFHARGLPLCDAEGRVLRWYVLLTDIDDRKQAEEALTRVRAELAHVARVSSLAVLTASIAHEVNQPLSGIVTNASTCLRMLNSDPPNIDGARETARRTIRDGNRAADVMTRLRALFKKKDVAAESVDLNDAAREVIALSSSELQSNRILVRHEFAENLPAVKGDRIQIQQVVLNLLRNASDAMRDVEDRPRELLIKTEIDDSENVQLTVQDTGIGFAPDTADRLFESFYTTKDDGMGIGLSVSRSIIEAHRGRLWASANEGPGSSFVFSIPRDYSIEAS